MARAACHRLLFVLFLSANLEPANKSNLVWLVLPATGCCPCTSTVLVPGFRGHGIRSEMARTYGQWLSSFFNYLGRRKMSKITTTPSWFRARCYQQTP